MTATTPYDDAVMEPAPHKRLWQAVLVQAYKDLLYEEYGTQPYHQAEAFFFGATWLCARRTVCDCLGIDIKDIAEPAYRIRNRRREAEGKPPIVPPEPAKGPIVMPRLIAEFLPPPPRPRRGGRKPAKGFVFNPFADLPSEGPAES